MFQPKWCFSYPTGLAYGSDGSIFVADNWNHRVQKLTSDGIFITSWGGYGSAEREFSYPEGIATDTDGNIYIVDSWN
ncbi:MAG: 6-bladed beta-propeller, partial [Planctomycetes bacterium]|nr:6-bladed beta-propeller [Planctomycetota bacterium]